MNNPFLENPSILRKEWKAVRSKLTADLSDYQHLEIVVNWWSRCPLSKQWLDYDNESTWPDPWELITTKNLDYSAIALGMEYTLLLGTDERWTADRVQICLASDTERTMQHLIVLVDNTWILNAYYGQIVELTNNLNLHFCYKFDRKKHVQII